MAELHAVDLRIELPGAAAITAHIENRVANLEDLRPAFREIVTTFRRHVQEAFDTEGGSTAAGRWAALSPGYKARKEKSHPGKTILRRSDALMRSLAGGAGSIEEIGAQEMTVGSALSTPSGRWNLGLIHQEGTDDGRVPARPIIDLSDQQRKEYRKILSEHVWDED